MQYENYPEIVNNLISSLINSLLTSLDSNIFSVLDELAFIKSSSITDTYFNSFFTKQFNIITLSEILLFGFLLYYAISYLFSFLTCSHFQKPLSFVSRLFFSALLIHFSLPICEKVLDFFFLITSILRTLGHYIFSVDLSFSLLYEKIINLFFSNLSSPFKFFSFDGVLKSFLSFGFVNLLFTYSIRFVFIKILVLLSPIAFLSLCLDQSIWIFKIWLKNLISQLFTQIIICVILFIIFSLSSTTNPIITKLLYVASVVCLMKASSFVKDFSSGFTTDISSSFSSIKSLFY